MAVTAVGLAKRIIQRCSGSMGAGISGGGSELGVQGGYGSACTAELLVLWAWPPRSFDILGLQGRAAIRSAFAWKLPIHP